jgi:threonine dehydrogenase-like Zn-dependent dehydrogenase
MRALVLGPSGIRLENAPLPRPEADCVIRVTHAGICGTDLQMLAGYADFAGTPGHEFVGVVEDTPAADHRWKGKRVVGEINVGCGTCRWCQSGVKEHCPVRTVLGIRGRSGAFAEYVALPAGNLHEIPRRVDDYAAVFVEPIAAACRIFEQVPIEADTRLLVIGDGRLGNLTAQVLKTQASHVVLAGRHAHKMAIAREVGIDARHEFDVSERYDVVVEATGRPEGLARAIDLVEPRGTIVLKSTCHGNSSLPLWTIPVHEVTVVGSRCGPFKPAIALLESGAVCTEPLIAQTFALEEYERAFATARANLKAVFVLRS